MSRYKTHTSETNFKDYMSLANYLFLILEDFGLVI